MSANYNINKVHTPHKGRGPRRIISSCKDTASKQQCALLNIGRPKSQCKEGVCIGCSSRVTLLSVVGFLFLNSYFFFSLFSFSLCLWAWYLGEFNKCSRVGFLGGTQHSDHITNAIDRQTARVRSRGQKKTSLKNPTEVTKHPALETALLHRTVTMWLTLCV